MWLWGGRGHGGSGLGGEGSGCRRHGDRPHISGPGGTVAEPGSEMLASLERGSGPFQQRGQHRPRHGGISWLTWLRDQGGVWRVERRGTGGHPRVCWPGPLPTFTGRHHGHHLGADEMQNLGPHTAFLSPSLHVTRPPPCTFLLPSPTADSKAH